MAAYLYTWNPENWDWKDQDYAISRIANLEPYDMTPEGFWSLRVARTVSGLNRRSNCIGRRSG